MEGFLIRKLRDEEENLNLFPPKNLAVHLVEGGAELSWSNNPKNETLIKNLSNNPLLTLSYKVYRWAAGAEPQVIKSLPFNRNRFVDRTLDPIGKQYHYSVLSMFEGTVGHQKTLIESQRSDVKSIQSQDRFKLRLVSGKPDSVNVAVTLDRDGKPLSQVFTVGLDEEIGGVMTLPGFGPVDFSTTLVLTAITVKDETREELVRHPVFNSDGSRSLDPIKETPIYEEKWENRVHETYLITCTDPSGNLREIVEN